VVEYRAVQLPGARHRSQGQLVDHRRERLGGKRIGVIQGTVSDTWLAAAAPTAQSVRFPNDAAALSALKTATIDGAVFDHASAEQYAAETRARS
jgi:ABC-type amino acid transport substrate-binding protein